MKKLAKSAIEKQIEKQMRQQKQLADKQRRDEQKRAREQQRADRKEAIRQQASSIISGQPFIEGFRIMDATAENMLQCLLQYERSANNRVCFQDNLFPEYVQMAIPLELEKLTQYGMIGGLMSFDNGGILNLLPPAITYFEDKENALSLQKSHQEEKQMQSIINYGNLVFGNVSDSTLTVDNSIHEIERAIEDRGGADKTELYELLDEVRELISNIETSRSIPKQKKLHQKLLNHLEQHGWFYGAIIQLLGTATMGMLGA